MVPIIVAALLATAGMVVTFWAPHSMRAKSVWLGLFLLSGLGLVASSYVQQQAAQQMIAERDAVLAKVQDHVTQLLNMVNTPAMNPGPPPIFAAVLGHLEVKRGSQTGQADLQIEAAYLSTQILEFLAGRHQNEPPPLHALTWVEDLDAQTRYLRETMTSFSEQFGSKVVAMRNRLATHGLVDKALDLYYDQPTNPTEIRVIAERIGALGQRVR